MGFLTQPEQTQVQPNPLIQQIDEAIQRRSDPEFKREVVRARMEEFLKSLPEEKRPVEISEQSDSLRSFIQQFDMETAGLLNQKRRIEDLENTQKLLQILGDFVIQQTQPAPLLLEKTGNALGAGAGHTVNFLEAIVNELQKGATGVGGQDTPRAKKALRNQK